MRRFFVAMVFVFAAGLQPAAAKSPWVSFATLSPNGKVALETFAKRGSPKRKSDIISLTMLDNNYNDEEMRSHIKKVEINCKLKQVRRLSEKVYTQFDGKGRVVMRIDYKKLKSFHSKWHTPLRWDNDGYNKFIAKLCDLM